MIDPCSMVQKKTLVGPVFLGAVTDQWQVVVSSLVVGVGIEAVLHYSGSRQYYLKWVGEIYRVLCGLVYDW